MYDDYEYNEEYIEETYNNINNPGAPNPQLTTDEVFILFLALFVGMFMYLIDFIYKKNKKSIWICILFPLYIIFPAYKYRDSLHEGLLYIGVALLFILSLGLMTQTSYFSTLMNIFSTIVFWQFKLVKFIYPYVAEYLSQLTPKKFS